MINDYSKQSTFRSFLNESTNLLTIFGILNALVLFARDLQTQNSLIDLLLPLSLLLLSLLVWSELLILAFERMHRIEFRMVAFSALSAMVEIMLIIYVFQAFGELVIGIVSLSASTFGIIYGMIAVETRLVRKIRNPRFKTFVSWFALVIAVLAFVVVLYFTVGRETMTYLFSGPKEG